jgi:DHA1 family tetracycline resistance protein-like MFS transporter
MIRTATSRNAGLPFILVAVFMDILGIGLALPVLPMLVGEYTATRELQAYWYGALVVAYGGMQFLCAPLLGALSDRYGRRPVLLLSIFGLGLHYLLTAVAPSLAFLLLARVIGGVTGGSYSVANAYISDVTTRENRARSFGLLGAVFGLGFICGPVLGGVLGGIDLHLPFYAAAGLSLVNGLYGYLMVPESLTKDRRAPFSLANANPVAALLRLVRNREVGSLVAVFALVVLAQVLLQTSWVLFTHFRFDWGPRENGFSLFTVGVMATVVQGGLMGRLLRNFGEVRLALLGLATGAVAFLLYGLAQEGWMIFVIIVAHFLSFAVPPALQAIVSKSVEVNEQGVTLGSLSSINSFMFIVAPLIGAPLLGRVSQLPASDWRVGATFYVSALLQTLALALAWRHFSRRRVAAAI